MNYPKIHNIDALYSQTLLVAKKLVERRMRLQIVDTFIQPTPSLMPMSQRQLVKHNTSHDPSAPLIPPSTTRVAVAPVARKSNHNRLPQPLSSQPYPQPQPQPQQQQPNTHKTPFPQMNPFLSRVGDIMQNTKSSIEQFVNQNTNQYHYEQNQHHHQSSNYTNHHHRLTNQQQQQQQQHPQQARSQMQKQHSTIPNPLTQTFNPNHNTNNAGTKQDYQKSVAELLDVANTMEQHLSIIRNYVLLTSSTNNNTNTNNVDDIPNVDNNPPNTIIHQNNHNEDTMKINPFNHTTTTPGLDHTEIPTAASDDDDDIASVDAVATPPPNDHGSHNAAASLPTTTAQQQQQQQQVLHAISELNHVQIALRSFCHSNLR